MTNDNELLRRYACDCSEDDFTALVRRHVDLVYSAALREARGDGGMAEDITQAAFVELARKASKLCRHPALAGWLYTSVRRMTANVRRANQRRGWREQEAQTMNEPIVSGVSESDWRQIHPVLDDAMHELRANDRTAIVLRFFEQHALKEVGLALGVNENTARMRVNRALERLRAVLARRGITSTATGLAGVVVAGAVLSAPSGFAVTIAKGALAASAVGTSTLASIFNLMSMTNLKTGVASAVIVAASMATPLVMQHQAQIQMSDENQSLLEKIEQMSDENQRMSDVVAQAKNAQSLSKDHLAELIGLRGEVTTLRAREHESASAIANVRTLQYEVDGLQSELENLEAESIRGRFRPRTDWVDQGNADPFSAVETMLWAFGHDQQARLTDVTTRVGLNDSDLFPAEHSPIQSIGAVNLISSFQNQEGTRAVVTAFVKEDFIAPPGGDPYSVNYLQGWQLKKSDDGWRVDKKLFFSLGRY